jgi:polyhydroxyalkanoate synthesis regulator protein
MGAKPTAAPEPAKTTGEVEALKAQLAAMQEQIDKLK